ncbi:MAG: hypothetical protein V2A34_07795 [Lentisphaerota bacterium]
MPVTKIEYKGWKNAVRLEAGGLELVVVLDVGPRIMHLGFKNGRNVFGEFPEQAGQSGEAKWMLRGGHRLWVAPENKPLTYELDNGPARYDEIPGGLRILQSPGPLTGIQKIMEIKYLEKEKKVSVVHTLKNAGSKAVACAPWALSVMAPGGLAMIPLPGVEAPGDRVTPNQNWALWSYTDLADRRWAIGSEYILLRHDATRGPTKIGIGQRDGWMGYLVDGHLFLKYFHRIEGAEYPDFNVNCEVYADERIVELETLGPLASLEPGQSASHEEQWALFKDIPDCTNEEEVQLEISSYVL